MSTRQLRLNTESQFREKLKDFTGKKINIVLNDRTVVLVLLLQIGNDALEVLNMRLKKVIIPINTINEIYFDTKE